jgi:hypothetical protein
MGKRSQIKLNLLKNIIKEFEVSTTNSNEVMAKGITELVKQLTMVSKVFNDSMVNSTTSLANSMEAVLKNRILRYFVYLLFLGETFSLLLLFYGILTGKQNIVIQFSFIKNIFLIIIYGYLLYIVRLNLKILYGTTELLVGIVAAYLALIQKYDLQNPLNYIFSVMAGLYIIIRGLNFLESSIQNEAVRNNWNKFFYRKQPIKGSIDK